MVSSKKIFGKIIREERKKRHLQQQQLADLLGVDRQYMCKLEAGKVNMTLDYFDRIIKRLKNCREEFINETISDLNKNS